MNIQPLHRAPNAAIQIANQLLASIRSHIFAVGEKLPGEIQLAEQFQVSRATVREALGALQFAGYIESVRGSGTRVIANHPGLSYYGNNQLTFGQVLDLLETRFLLEPEIVALAACDPNTKALAEARDLIQGMALAVDEPWIQATTDIRVHQATAKICKNNLFVEHILKLLDHASAPILLKARQTAWSNPQLTRQWVSQHEQILIAISEGRADMAATVSREHIRTTTRNILNALGIQHTGEPANQEYIMRFKAGPMGDLFP